MKWLASRRWRIFLIAWLIYSVHFATNVVREHYPAFAIAEHGTFRVDEYLGFHADIFKHRDGHSVIGNQVFVSVLAAIPLFVFDPVLDWLEAKSKDKIAREGVSNDQYRIDKPMRVEFFRLVKARGLDLRFGAATFITCAFFQAPITAAFLVYFYDVLRRRGLEAGDATALTFLLGFGTPLFYRSTTLSHNLFVMYPMFFAFVLMWMRGSGRAPVGRRLLIGLFGGLTLATDYVGVIILPLLFGYFIVTRRDARRCAAPMCGGFFVKRVNEETTKCADGELHEECAILEPVDQVSGDLEAEPGLPSSAGASERYDSWLLAARLVASQQVANGGNFPLAPEEFGEISRQIARNDWYCL